MCSNHPLVVREEYFVKLIGILAAVLHTALIPSRSEISKKLVLVLKHLEV